MTDIEKTTMPLTQVLVDKYQMDLFPPTGGARRCKDCANCLRKEAGNSVFFYCRVKFSGRTYNRLKKIKANDPECGLFKAVTL